MATEAEKAAAVEYLAQKAKEAGDAEAAQIEAEQQGDPK